jgi:glycosyltransferase involved in cell wall biosynthesis
VLVSVITPTHRRHQQLLRAIRSVDTQTYDGTIEQLVIADGPDPDVRELDGYGGFVRVIELGRNWHGISNGWGAEARMAGTLLARGDLIAYLDDDNVLDDEHVGNLALLLQLRGVDFVHSQMRMPDGRVIGSETVAVDAIDTGMVLHRAECLRFGHWRPAGYASDGHLYSSWVAGGATHAHWPSPTYSYRPA